MLNVHKQLINMDGIKLQPFDMHKSQPITIASSFAFSAIVCFSQHLKCETYMVASHDHHVVPCLQRCLPPVVTSNAVHDLRKCYMYINLWHRRAWGFTDISTLSLGHCAPSGLCVYISQTPCCRITINNVCIAPFHK